MVSNCIVNYSFSDRVRIGSALKRTIAFVKIIAGVLRGCLFWLCAIESYENLPKSRTYYSKGCKRIGPIIYIDLATADAKGNVLQSVIYFLFCTFVYRLDYSATADLIC